VEQQQFKHLVIGERAGSRFQKALAQPLPVAEMAGFLLLAHRGEVYRRNEPPESGQLVLYVSLI